MNKLDYTKMRSTKEEESQKFNFNSAVKELLAGKKISGKDGVLAPLVKQLVEAALEAEVESHIANEALSGNKNRRKTCLSLLLLTNYITNNGQYCVWLQL